MVKNQSDLAINVALIQDIKQRDLYFFLRMGLRPDLHKRFYPHIPLILSSEKKTKQTKPEGIFYGEDPYQFIREHFPCEIEYF